ncbi:MAG: cupin domain-containing protein [bacterium]|nr:cupin domain-containing protein [bacterium]
MKSSYRVEDVAFALQCEPDQEAIVSALAERDYRIFEVEQPAGAIVPYHTHDEEETIVLLDGRVQFNVEEELVVLEKGEMITIRAGAIHAAAPVDGDSARILLGFGKSKSAPPQRDAAWDEYDEEDDEIV